MIKINKKVEYALIALKHMALKAPSELTSAREISDKYRTPFDTTAKIMQNLNRARILSSNQGVKGGYTLSKSLKSINYIELSEIVERKQFDFSCEGPKGLCEMFDCCNIKNPINALNFKLKEFFLKVSIHELLLISEQQGQCESSITLSQNNTEVGQ